MISLYAIPRFAPLPAKKYAATCWPDVAAALSEHPGEWAAVGEQDSGRCPITPHQRRVLDVEVTTRSNGDGTYPRPVDPGGAPVIAWLTADLAGWQWIAIGLAVAIVALPLLSSLVGVVDDLLDEDEVRDARRCERGKEQHPSATGTCEERGWARRRQDE